MWEAGFRIFGLRVYEPYLIPTIAAHLGVVALLRLILLRLGSAPWLATGLSLLVLFTGAGAGDVAFGWQVSFVGSVFFGLAQLLLTDHDGPIDRRDAAGLLLGLCGLMCSAVSLAMVAWVGVNLALRRRWLAAAIAVGPLVAVFLAWYLLIGRAGDLSHFGYPPLSRTQLAVVPGFVWQGVLSTLGGLAGLPGILVLAGLTALAVIKRSELRLNRPGMSLAWAGAVAAVWFFVEVALGRYGRGASFAEESRYLYVGVVMVLPLIGASLSTAMVTPRRVALAGLLIGWALIANLDALFSFVHNQDEVSKNLKSTVLQLAADPTLDRMDSQQALSTGGAMWIDIGLIKRLRDEHALPVGSG